MDRVFSEQPLDAALPCLELNREEVHHLVRVRRHRDGDPVLLLDGRGRTAAGRLEVRDRNHAQVRFDAVQEAPAPRPACHLAVALPTGKTMDWIVQKATELGAASIIPLISARSEVQLDERRATEKVRRWQSIAIESVKQCGNPYLPVIETPIPLEVFLRRMAPGTGQVLIASLEEKARRLEAAVGDEASASWTLLVGPEGDFTETEYVHAREAGCRPVTLGTLILRVETAAITGLARLIAAVGR